MLCHYASQVVRLLNTSQALSGVASDHKPMH